MDTEARLRDDLQRSLTQIRQFKQLQHYRDIGIQSIHDLEQHIRSTCPRYTHAFRIEDAIRTARSGSRLEQRYPTLNAKQIMQAELQAILYTRERVRWAVLVLTRKKRMIHITNPDDVSRCIRVFLKHIWDYALDIPSDDQHPEPHTVLTTMTQDGTCGTINEHPWNDDIPF